MNRRCKLLVLSLLLSTASRVRSEKCSLCSMPEQDFSDQIIVELPGLGLIDCHALATLVVPALTRDSEECDFMQAYAVPCGCPDELGDNACQLCDSGARAQDENTLINMGGTELSCGVLEMYLRSLPRNTEGCGNGQMYADQCGCPKPSHDILEEPTHQDSQDAIPDMSGPCTLCRTGLPTNPELDITDMIEEAGLLTEYLLGQRVTCGFVHSYLQQFEELHESCLRGRAWLTEVCSCPTPESNQCDICPNGGDIDADKLLPRDWINDFASVDFVPTCRQFASMLSQNRRSGQECFFGSFFSEWCGCDDTYSYLGSKNRAQERAVVWLPRASGTLSLIGSLIIMGHVIKRHGRKASVYHGMMLGLSLFDIVGSVGWIASTAALPSSIYGVESDVFGALGNEATCLAHAFFRELGMIGSAFYNLSLSFYYVFMLVSLKKAKDLRRIRLLLHAVPIVMALALAFGAFPYYEKTRFCHVSPPYQEDAWISIVFVIVPLGFVIVVASVNMAMAYWSVRTTLRKANRWRFGVTEAHSPAETSTDSFYVNERSVAPARHATESNSTERAVFWKGFLYLLSFLLTWPFYMATMIFFEELSDIYPYWIISYIFLPLQGFFNCIVYFTPVAVEYLEKRRIHRQQSQSRLHCSQFVGGRSTRVEPTALQIAMRPSSGSDEPDAESPETSL